MPVRPFSRSASDASARRTYELLDEPTGSDYRALLAAATSECATAVLTVPPDLRERGAVLLGALIRRHPAPQVAGPVRLEYDAHTADLLARSVDSLYGWRRPELPESLCLFRADGSPWLITVAPRRTAYVELSVLERARLSHTAPGVAAALVNRGARDAVLGTLEHRLEERVEALALDLEAYVAETAGAHREVLCDALEAWLSTADDVRAAVAVQLARGARLVELAGPLQSYAARLRAGSATPPPLAAHEVLRARWLARRLRLIDDALADLAAEARL
ncbi:MAG: hypothetical protein ACYDAC_07800 [Candidatus Dormibacteria bacterium]